MRIDLHARVITREGETAGNIDRAVVDPQTNEVTEFVVSTGGLLGKNFLVPQEQVDQVSADGDELRLCLDKHELEQLPTYEPADSAAPPPNWLPPLGYGLPSVGYVWPNTPPRTEAPAGLREPWQAPR